MATPISKYGGTYSGADAPVSKFGGTYSGAGETLEARQAEIARQIAEEEGPVGAFLAGAGYDLTKVGRGLERMARPAIDVAQNLMAAPGFIEPPGPAPNYADIAAQAEQEYAPLREAYPTATGAGELTSAILSTAPAALLPGGPQASMAARMGTGAGVGAFDLGTRAAGSGETVGGVLAEATQGGGMGAAVEAMFPPLIALGSKIVRKITGRLPQGTLLDNAGQPTEELRDALDKADLSFNDLTAKAKEMLESSAGADPGAAVRASIFDDLNIPSTQSRIGQDPADFLAERTLARDPTEYGKILNERLADEALAFNDVAVDLRNQLGLPEEAADAIRLGLESRVAQKKEGVDQAYEKLRRLSHGEGIPLFGGNILESLNSDRVRQAAGKLNSRSRDDINDVLIEYGIDTDPERTLGWLVSRQKKEAQGAIPVKTDITPLNVLNFSDMHSDLNALLDPNDPHLNTVVGILKDSLLKEKDSLYAVLKIGRKKGDMGGVGKIAENVIEAATVANDRFIEYSAIINPQKLVGKMVAKKRGTFDMPMIASDAVLGNIIGKGPMGTLENADMLVRNLLRAGPKGEKALGDLQSFIIADLTNTALQRNKKLANDVRAWSGARFKTRMDQIGRDKIAVIFKNNPSASQQLRKLELAGDATLAPETVARSSGTGDDVLNAMKKNTVMQNIFVAAGAGLGYAGSGTAVSTGVGALAAMGGVAANRIFRDRQSRIQLQKILNTSPLLQNQLSYIQYRFPNIAATLGLNRLYAGKEEEK